MPDPDIAPAPLPAPAPAAAAPDMLKVPTNWRPPRGTRKPIFDAMFDMADATLGLDPAKGQGAHRSSLPNENMFLFKKTANDTLLFPINHYLAGRPRFVWVKQPNGMVYGFLTQEAKDELAAEAANPTT